MAPYLAQPAAKDQPAGRRFHPAAIDKATSLGHLMTGP
jgi:hypothetical protein